MNHAIAGALYVLDDATVRKMLSLFVDMRKKEENASSATRLQSVFQDDFAKPVVLVVLPCNLSASAYLGPVNTLTRASKIQ